MPWVSPSIKAAEKLPCIEIVEVGQVQTYLDWFDAHEEINRCIPPLYREFTIKFSRSYTTGRPKPEAHHYMEIVHYDDSLTELEAAHVLDGKKILHIYVNYSEISGKKIHVKLKAPVSSPFTESWLRSEAVAVAYTILAVHASNVKQSSARKIRPTVRKYIRLSASDSISSVRNYRAIQWQVRGHYRRIVGADGKERLVYVRPHLAKRGKKKTATHLIIEN